MRTQEIALRLNGLLTKWQDNRGFGFITPSGGGQDIFVHVKAFERGCGRPVLNGKISFELEVSADGKKRAKNVRQSSCARAAYSGGAKSAAPWERASIAALAGFALIYSLVTLIWGTQLLLTLAYLVISVICALAYWHDKSAAQSKQWRVPETTLLMLGLFGGWPGAIVAQQTLRHKTSKVAFRLRFWTTVILNMGFFLIATTPLLHSA